MNEENSGRGRGTDEQEELDAASQQLEAQNQQLRVEIEERRQAEEEANYHKNLERVITEVATGLMNVDANEIDKKIIQALGKIGEFAGADRSYIFQFRDDLERMDNTHEWCAAGIKSQKEDLQDVSTDQFPWVMGKLKNFENIPIARVSDLPTAAESERDYFQDLNLESLLLLPLVYDNNLKGFIGYDRVKEAEEWTEEVVELLRIAGEGIVNVLVQAETEEELRAAYQQLEAHNQQLDAYNQQLQATEQQLRVEIEERKKIEKELLKNKNLLDSILETQSGLVVVLDADGKIVRFNSACEALTGYKAEEVIGKKVWDIFIDDQEEAEVKEVFESLVAHDYPNSHDNFWKTKDGERRLIAWNNNVITDDEENIKFVVGTGIDITEHKEREEELIAANQQLDAYNQQLEATEQQLRAEIEERTQNEKELEDALAEKETLLQEVHHRVKNNLQVIYSLLRMQRHELEAEASQEVVEAFESSCRRVLTMAEVHKQIYSTEHLATVAPGNYIRDLTNSIVQTHELAFTPVLEFEIDEETELDIDTAIPCGLILNELISNALEHAFEDAGGRNEIKIELKRENNRFCLRVIDNGRGLAEDFNLEEASSLGLQMVRALTEDQLRGEFNLNVDGGTKVEICFPELN